MFSKELQIPQDVTLEISGNNLVARGPKGEIKKNFKMTKDIKVEKLDSKVKVFSESERRVVKAEVGAIAAHIKNAVDGVTKGYTYRMRVIYSHFPITVKIEGDKVLVNNFLGERVPRIARIIGKTQVKIEQQDLIVTGSDVDEVSQTAANIEQTCRIVGYDKKIFQDGIYIISKGE
jgi:large subunit ribosomal protein L6